MIRPAAALLVLAATVLVGAAPPAAAASPTVAGFSPASGPLGTTVTVTGTGFVPGSVVRFGGAASTKVTVTSPTRLTATVPAAAVTGAVSVSIADGPVGAGGTFTVTPGVVVSPTSGPPTTRVTLTGSAFAANEAVDVFVDTTAVALTVATTTGRTGVSVTVPAAAAPGEHWLTLLGRRSGLAAQTAFTVRTDWPADGGGPAHRGTAAHENVVSTSSVGRLDERFRVDTGDVSVALGVAVANGVAYLASPNVGLTAVSGSTGAVLWTRPVVGTQTVDTAPAVGGSLVYVGTGSALTAVRTRDGTVAWTTGLGSSPAGSTLSVANGLVVTSVFDGRTVAVDAVTGAVRWTDPGPGEGPGWGPVISNGRVYVGAVDQVTSLALATGTRVWTSSLPRGVTGNPTVANGAVYLPAGSDLVALRVLDGRSFWVSGLGDVAGSPAVDGGTVYVPTGGGSCVALAAGSGAIQWVASTGVGQRARPVVANGVVFVPTSSGIDALDENTGGALWGAPDPNTVAGPAVTDGTLWVPTFDGGLVAYSPDGAAPAVGARPAVRALRSSHPVTAST